MSFQPLRVASVLLAALAVGTVAGAPAEPCELIVRWQAQAPYWLARPGAQPTGYLAQTVLEAADRIGCDVRFKEMSWARGVAELEAARIDLMAGAQRTPERERFARFTRPVNLSRNMLFLRAEVASTVALPGLSSLADTELRIGIEPGAMYSPEYRRLLEDPRFLARLRPNSVPKSQWQMLATGRLDGLITDEVSALTQSAAWRWGVVLQPVLIVSSASSHIMVGRHLDAAKAEALDAALEAMVAEGWLPRQREAWVPCATDPATMGCRSGERITAAGAPVPPPDDPGTSQP